MNLNKLLTNKKLGFNFDFKYSSYLISNILVIWYKLLVIINIYRFWLCDGFNNVEIVFINVKWI